MKRVMIISSLMTILFFSTCVPKVVFASSENWVEVARFNGTAFTFGVSDPFQIYHEEWRVLWETNNLFHEIEHFDFYVLHEDDVTEDGSIYTNNSIGSIRTTANENGTLNIHGSIGTFIIWVSPSPATWELIIEQNINSIPEFPSWTFLPVLIIGILAVVIFRKKL
ncbi:MAG: hypothetical protein NUK63_09375 [Candidatus Bathyarchaeum tardum]|nr:MAG: hypothetical protein NUK63_09375 [Candidatus Bathyarchaeum tardum]